MIFRIPEEGSFWLQLNRWRRLCLDSLLHPAASVAYGKHRKGNRLHEDQRGRIAIEEAMHFSKQLQTERVHFDVADS